MVIEKPLLFRSVSVPVWLPILLILAAYTGWEAYWYTQVGLNFIKWHTHFMVLVVVWFMLGVLCSGFKNGNTVLGVVSAVMITLIAVEAALMFTGYNKSYIEKRGGMYQSLFNQQNKDSLRTFPPNGTHRLKTPEYDYPRSTNVFGFSDGAFKKEAGKLLIQTYGDSFTEGDGAPADSSYPAILRTLLGENYQVQNYGISGNDPGFYVTQFGKLGAQFQPDVILLCYGTGDFEVDVFSRGGLERFTALGWQTRKGPWWEVIYAMSYVSRLVFHTFGIEYNNFFMRQAAREKELKKLEPKWNEMFAALARLAAQDHTKVLLFKKPEHSEIKLNKYQYDMAFFDSFLKQHPVFLHVDLLPAYRRFMKIDKGGSTAPYYWQQDGHHNPTGYHAMANVVYEALDTTGLLSLPLHTIKKHEQ